MVKKLCCSVLQHVVHAVLNSDTVEMEVPDSETLDVATQGSIETVAHPAVVVAHSDVLNCELHETVIQTAVDVKHF